MNKAVFLDRDGVLIKVRYLENVTGDAITPKFVTCDQVIVLPGVPEALKRLKEAGFLLIVVTNQGYVARGDVTWDELNEVNDFVNRESGGYIDAFYVCPHPAKVGCQCRKPGTLLFEEAAEKFDIDLSRSFMAGDRLSDIKAGRNAGCRDAFLLRYGGWGERTLAGMDEPPDFPVCDGLLQAAEEIIRIDRSHQE